MKKVLVTGASGAIGINILKYLLSEGKYEVTAVDLPNNRSSRSLKKYKKRLNVIFADLTDTVICDGLVKDQDYIIHLASVTPSLGNLKKELYDIVDYKVTENIVRAISFYNPKCMLLFASTTSLYKAGKEEVTVDDKPSISEIDYYSASKFKCENLIKNNIENYTIFRLPMVLTNPSNSFFVYNGVSKELVEAISDLDASYAFVKALDIPGKLNKKTFNLAGGKTCTITYKELINKILLAYGISFKYISNLIFINKNFHGHIYNDGDKLNDLLYFRNDSVSSYIMRLRRTSRKRIVQRFFGRILVWIRNVIK